MDLKKRFNFNATLRESESEHVSQEEKNQRDSNEMS